MAISRVTGGSPSLPWNRQLDAHTRNRSLGTRWPVPLLGRDQESLPHPCIFPVSTAFLCEGCYSQGNAEQSAWGIGGLFPSLPLIGFSERTCSPPLPQTPERPLHRSCRGWALLVFRCHINPVGGLTARHFEKQSSSHESPQMQLKWLLAGGKHPLLSNTAI